MKKLAAIAALAAGLTATPALAQVGPEGGLYAGVILGYEGINIDSSDESVSADADSAVYGVTVGYDYPIGAAFVGVEGEIAKSGGTATFPASFDGARESLESDGQFYVGARGGVALTPGIAAYGKVGYVSVDLTTFTEAGSFDDLNENAGGLRYGAGVQVALPGPFEARLEYRRSRLKDLDDGTYGDATTDQVVAGFGVRF